MPTRVPVISICPEEMAEMLNIPVAEAEAWLANEKNLEDVRQALYGGDTSVFDDAIIAAWYLSTCPSVRTTTPTQVGG